MTRRGKSRSKRPVSKRPPVWFKYDSDEVEALVVKLAKEGNAPSQIGIILRDQHGIPLVKPITGKTIGKILEENDLSPKIPEDLNNLIEKSTRLRRHLAKNKADIHNRRSLDLVESKIRRFAKYYRKEGALPKDWKYKPKAVRAV